VKTIAFYANVCYMVDQHWAETTVNRRAFLVQAIDELDQRSLLRRSNRLAPWKITKRRV